jgi:hypothetical protein
MPKVISLTFARHLKGSGRPHLTHFLEFQSIGSLQPGQGFNAIVKWSRQALHWSTDDWDIVAAQKPATGSQKPATDLNSCKASMGRPQSASRQFRWDLPSVTSPQFHYFLDVQRTSVGRPQLASRSFHPVLPLVRQP